MGALKPKLLEESGKLGMFVLPVFVQQQLLEGMAVRETMWVVRSSSLESQSSLASPHPFKATTVQMS